MISVQLRMYKTAQELEDRSIDKAGKYILIPVWFNKITEELFVEVLPQDLPEEVKNQISKPEKIY